MVFAAMLCCIVIATAGGIASAKSTPPPVSRDDVGVSVVGPVNDNKANATVITNASGSSTAQTNVDATLESNEVGIFGETSDGTSVWYSWTAPTNGVVIFQTVLGSLQDSTLGVYAPGSFPLTPIGTNDDCCNGFASEVAFTAVQGSTYLIRVAGFGNAVGTFDLQWFPDTTNPTVESLSLKVKGARVVASFSGSDNVDVARFECSVDLGGPDVCASPFTTIDYPKGEHTFYVTVFDTSGNSAQDSLNFAIKSGKVKI
jgi:hypothetical protein